MKTSDKSDYSFVILLLALGLAIYFKQSCRAISVEQSNPLLSFAI